MLKLVKEIEYWLMCFVNNISNTGLSCFSQCSATGVSKATICAFLSVGKFSPCGGIGFPHSLSELSFTK